MEGEGEGESERPPLPSNYVTILQLKERWLQQHHRQKPAPAPPHLPESKPHDDEADSQFNPKPNDEAALKLIPRRRLNRQRVINQLKPEGDSKTEADVDDNHPKGENANSKLPKKKKGSTARKPRSVTHQNPNGSGTQLLEPEPEPELEPVEEKREFRHRRVWNQKVVLEPKDKTASLAQNVDDNDVPGDGVVEAVAAAVKESNVSEGTNRRGGSGRFQGKPWLGPSKPPFGVKKGQTSLVWVKKGESATNQAPNLW